MEAVKTEKQAIRVIQAWLNSIFTDELSSIDTYVQPCSARCACGETKGMEGFYEVEGGITAQVAICDACGDDDAFHDDVLLIN